MTAMMNRRHFLNQSLLAAAAGTAHAADSTPSAPVAPSPVIRNRIGVSTYSFWGFDRGEFATIEKCLELAADMGFDGVEILQVQMDDFSPQTLMKIKRRAFTLGLDLMGLSTHQGFLSPQEDKRREHVLKTAMFLEQAYDLGIPTIRVADITMPCAAARTFAVFPSSVLQYMNPSSAIRKSDSE